ncbi:MAG: DUF308 domain-containing protein [Leptolyngbyaceae bacterium]|nr:DUF308 domain-containing protein [Leptolyngbyaceae bacterium]
MNSDPKQSITSGAAWLAALGVLMILIGASATITPLFSPRSIAFVLAWVFLGGGLIRVVQAFKFPTSRNFLLGLLAGVVDIVTSILIFSQIAGTTVPLRWAIAFTLILGGILETVLAVRLHREDIRNWGFVSGITSIALGIAAAAGIATGVTWLLGLLVGVSFAITGVWFLVLSSGIRSIVDS